MFAYCNNNPTLFSDPAGKRISSLKLFLQWLFGKGKTKTYSDKASVGKTLKRSKTMKNIINNSIESYKRGQTSTFAGAVTFTRCALIKLHLGSSILRHIVLAQYRNKSVSCSI